MYNFTMVLSDAQDVRTMQAWCKAQGIECKVTTSVNALPTLKGTRTQAQAPAQKPTASKTTKSRLDAKDVEVAIATTKTLATLGSGVSRDTFAVLKADAEALGGEWDKTLKGFKFATCKNAKAVSARKKVTADERNAVRKDWGWA